MRTLQLTSLAEEIQDYIADNATGLSLTYVTGGNFIIGDILDVQDLDWLVGSKVELAMFDEGGGVRPGSAVDRQERTFRFIHKGSRQLAVTYAQELLQWIMKQKTFQTSTFRVWVARADVLPSIFARYKSGTTLADFVVTFFAFNLV